MIETYHRSPVVANKYQNSVAKQMMVTNQQDPR